MRPQRALLGVHDKQGLVEFAAGLHRCGIELVATGGTEAELRRAGLPVVSVAELTGVPEMLEGRVKTLHPAVHAGILARRESAADRQTVADLGYRLIDMVVVNLYPFEEMATPNATWMEVVEAIDIGGPTLLRAAAKNWQAVAAVSSPDQYAEVLEALAGDGLTSAQLRRMALLVFQRTAAYDATIADFLGRQRSPEPGAWPVVATLSGQLRQPLRYGENPHQTGAIYRLGPGPGGLAFARQLQGPELSYTNWLDADSAWRLSQDLEGPAAVVVKHTNPCGVALAASPLEALQRAFDCDPRSAYGGIVALNQELDRDTAEELSRHFLELVVAPSVTAAALALLAPRSRLRVLRATPGGPRPGLDFRSIDGGFLLQTEDRPGLSPEAVRVVSRRHPTVSEWDQLRLAWVVVGRVKSNAIVLCRDGMAVGVGAGQMSRVEAVELAVQRAGDRCPGSCLASDAFFPMADGLEVAAAAGVTAAIHPGGSVRDQEVVAAADRQGMALVATGVRHFRH